MQHHHIKIMFVGHSWYDITNDCIAGRNAESLIKYVNDNLLIVRNQEAFMDYSEFWYNKEEK